MGRSQQHGNQTNRESNCIDFPDHNGDLFELAADKEQIHNILMDLVRETAHSVKQGLQVG